MIIQILYIMYHHHEKRPIEKMFGHCQQNVNPLHTMSKKKITGAIGASHKWNSGRSRKSDIMKLPIL